MYIVTYVNHDEPGAHMLEYDIYAVLREYLTI